MRTAARELRSGPDAGDAANLMLTTEQWVPVDGAHELSLMHALVSQRCRLVKPLRYDARDVAVFPNALLPDVGAVPVPRHVVSAFIAPKDSAANDVAGGELASAPQTTPMHHADGGHRKADDRVQPTQHRPERFRRKVVQQVAGDDEQPGEYAQADARSALNHSAVARRDAPTLRDMSGGQQTQQEQRDERCHAVQAYGPNLNRMGKLSCACPDRVVHCQPERASHE